MCDGSMATFRCFSTIRWHLLSAPFYRPYFYYLDFARGKVTLVTQSSLAGLLEDYHDLKMRYEGMRDYKNPEIIEDYFYRYIDRISQDDSRPRILDFNPSTID